jgi:hypothetical protein
MAAWILSPLLDGSTAGELISEQEHHGLQQLMSFKSLPCSALSATSAAMGAEATATATGLGCSPPRRTPA